MQVVQAVSSVKLASQLDNTKANGMQFIPTLKFPRAPISTDIKFPRGQ